MNDFDPTYKYPNSMIEEYDAVREEEMEPTCFFDKKKGIIGSVEPWCKSKLSDVWSWVMKK